MTLFMLHISSGMVMASLLLYVQGKGGWGQGPTMKECQEWVPICPIFFIQLLEQQFHQSHEFCFPHIWQSSFHDLATIVFQASYYQV